METVTVEKSLFGSFVFVLVSMSRRVQHYAGNVWLFVAIRPTLFLARSPRDYKKPFPYSIDSKKIGHGILQRIFNVVLRWNAKITGIQSVHSAYDRLLTWNPKIPTYGFFDGDSLATIEILGMEHKDGTRSVELTSITNPKPTGYISIIRKFTEDKSKQVILECAWTSGKEIGSTFILARDVGYRSLEAMKEYIEDKSRPRYVYLPPKFVVWPIEVLFGLGIIVAILSLVNDMFNSFDTQKRISELLDSVNQTRIATEAVEKKVMSIDTSVNQLSADFKKHAVDSKKMDKK